MKAGNPIPWAFIFLVGSALFTGGAVEAEASIAKVSRFTGEVIVQSGERIASLRAAEYLLNDGDLVQTKEGEVEILFNDGAILKLNPYSNAMIQERTEEGGFWIFKTKQEARRITCLLGKLFFQSGVAGKRNYLQTPTAVAGIRGSSGDIGFDNLNSYLHMYTGEAAVLGNMIRGFFQNPGISAAEKSAVYQALARAAQEMTGAQKTRRPLDMAHARVAVAQVGQLVAQSLLQNNPDANVKMDGELIASMTNAMTAKANTDIAVEQIREEMEKAGRALREAQATGDALKIAQAQRVLAAAAEALARAQALAQQAGQAMSQAFAAAKNRDLQGSKSAADMAVKAAQQAQEAAQKIITTTAATTVAAAAVTTTAPTTGDTTAETTVAPTTAATTTATTVVPTTVATTTTILTTIRTTTTTSSTTTVRHPSR